MPAPVPDEGIDLAPIARGAVAVALGGEFANNALAVVRLAVKYPEANRRGELGVALRLTAIMHPDARVVNPLAPRIASAASNGMSFTRFDEIAMKSSALLGASLSFIQLGSGIVNVVDAVKQDGPWTENIGGTTSGRAGVLGLAGGALGIGLFGTALHQTRDAATGIIPRILEAGKAPFLAKPVLSRVGFTFGATIIANELDYFNMFDTGEKRSSTQVLIDAAHDTPVLNSSVGRTAALGGAAAVTAASAASAIYAGGLRSVHPGVAVTGAAIAGLLGAQLLGRLDGLDSSARSAPVGA